MASLLSLQEIQSMTINLGKKINKIENERKYETGVSVDVNDKKQTLVFWTPVLQCMRKDENHLQLLLPQTDDCEEFYNTLVHIDDNVVKSAYEKWNEWFPKDELSEEDVQERFVSCIKAGSKDVQGRVMTLKTSSNIKCKIENSDIVTSEYSSLFDQKTRRGEGRVLVELRKAVFGRNNFKVDFIAHQILINEPIVEEKETEKFNNENWVDFQ